MFDPAYQSHLDPIAMQAPQAIGGSLDVTTQSENTARPSQRMTSAELYALQRRFDHFIEKLNAPRRRYSR